MTETARFIDKQFWRIAFVDEDDVDNKDGGLQDACEIFGPPPAKRWVGYECGGDDGSYTS